MLSEPIASPKNPFLNEIDLASLDSVALQRLIAEIRQQDEKGVFDTTLYNRTYHRHNR